MVKQEVLSSLKKEMDAEEKKRPYLTYTPFEKARVSSTLQCRFGRQQSFPVPFANGRTYFVNIIPPSGERNFRRARTALYKATKIYTKRSFAQAPDGLYSWLETETGFYACRVDNSLEFASRHLQIADRLRAKRIFLAGEVEKCTGKERGKDLVFNLSSGSFMRQLASGDTAEYPFQADAERLLRSLGDWQAVDYKDETVSIFTVPPVTEADLHRYASYGYHIFLYTDLKDCLEYQYFSLKQLRVVKRLDLEHYHRVNESVEDVLIAHQKRIKDTLDESETYEIAIDILKKEEALATTEEDRLRIQASIEKMEWLLEKCEALLELINENNYKLQMQMERVRGLFPLELTHTGFHSYI